jgi:hypothetical protein
VDAAHDRAEFVLQGLVRRHPRRSPRIQIALERNDDIPELRRATFGELLNPAFCHHSRPHDLL